MYSTILQTMQTRVVRFIALVSALTLIHPSNAVAQAAIPVRQLTRVISSDTSILMGIGSVRHLPNGSVMVNDPTKRQLVLFDSTLAKFRIIADTTTNTPNSYGLRSSNGGLVPYMADSTLFLDSESAAFLVFDQTGTFARMMAPTRASDMSWVASGYYGMAGFDPKGRMVYRTYRRSSNTQMAFDASIGPKITYQPDSAPLLRMDFDRRTVDTIGLLKIPVQKSYTVTTMNSITSYSVQNPLPMSDEWTLLPDGTVAIVRGQDYHIDWLSMDGKMTSSPKMPFDWKRITLEEKQQMIDSIKKADADMRAKNPPPPPVPGQPVFPARPFVTVDANELPDYYPAVRSGQVRADRDGYVWILPATSTAAKGGLLYDVVNRQGEVVERVQLPVGRTLVGFGPRGTIYMHNVQSPKSASIERAQVNRPPVP